MYERILHVMCRDPLKVADITDWVTVLNVR